MKTCKTCKYKTLEKDRDDRFLCSKLELGYEKDIGVVSEYALVSSGLEQLISGSSPLDAYFVTTDDFGCVLHEEKK